MAFPRVRSPLRPPLLRVLVAALVATGLAVPSAAAGPAAPAAASARAAAAGDAALSGLVTGAGQGLGNVWVTLTPVDAEGGQLGEPARTITDPSGRYEFASAPSSRVKLHARAPLWGGFVDTFWPGAYTFLAAGILDLSSGPVTADIDLAHGGSVSGVVVDSASGAAVPEARVTATVTDSPNSGSYGSAEPVEGAGRFAISGLPPVPMLLFVALPPGSSYLAPTYGGGSPPGDLRIDGSRETAGKVIRVGRGAEVHGTVRDETGTPVPGAEVELTGCRPGCPRPAVTDHSGAYRVTAIPPGSGLRVVAWEGPVGARVRQLIDTAERPPTGLLPQWYSGQDDEEDATLLRLRAGEARTVDFDLIRGAFVTVQVLGSGAEAPLSGVIAQLKPVDDPYERHFAQRLPEDPTRLRMGPVAPGDYTLRVNPGTANPGYLPVTEFVDPAVAPAGVIALQAGDRVEATVVLPAAAERPGGADAPTGADGPTEAPADGPGGTDGSQGSGGSEGSEGSGGSEGSQPPGGSDGSPASEVFAGSGDSGAWPGLEAGFLTAPTG